jgi:hypothetical protein
MAYLDGNQRLPFGQFLIRLLVLSMPFGTSEAAGGCAWRIEMENGRQVAVATGQPMHQNGKLEFRLVPRASDWQLDVRFEPKKPRFSDTETLGMLNNPDVASSSRIGIGDLHIGQPGFRLEAPWEYAQGAYRGRFALPDAVPSRFGSAWVTFGMDMANAVRDVTPEGSANTDQCASLINSLVGSRSSQQPLASGNSRGEQAPAAQAGLESGARGRQTRPLPYVFNNPNLTAIELNSWRLRKGATLMAATNSNAQALGVLAAGIRLKALAIEIHTIRPAVAEAVRNGELPVEIRSTLPGKEKKVAFAKGERLYTLYYYEEGYCAVSAKGVVGIAECNGNAMGEDNPLFRTLGSGNPEVEVWALVATGDGRRGWIKSPDAHGMSRHD